MSRKGREGNTAHGDPAAPNASISFAPKVSKSEAAELVAWVRRSNPSLEEIDKKAFDGRIGRGLRKP